jgi:hypothetical protein
VSAAKDSSGFEIIDGHTSKISGELDLADEAASIDKAEQSDSEDEKVIAKVSEDKSQDILHEEQSDNTKETLKDILETDSASLDQINQSDDDHDEVIVEPSSENQSKHIEYKEQSDNNFEEEVPKIINPDEPIETSDAELTNKIFIKDSEDDCKIKEKAKQRSPNQDIHSNFPDTKCPDDLEPTVRRFMDWENKMLKEMQEDRGWLDDPETRITEDKTVIEKIEKSKLSKEEYVKPNEDKIMKVQPGSKQGLLHQQPIEPNCKIISCFQPDSDSSDSEDNKILVNSQMTEYIEIQSSIKKLKVGEIAEEEIGSNNQRTGFTTSPGPPKITYQGTSTTIKCCGTSTQSPPQPMKIGGEVSTTTSEEEIGIFSNNQRTSSTSPGPPKITCTQINEPLKKYGYQGTNTTITCQGTTSKQPLKKVVKVSCTSAEDQDIDSISNNQRTSSTSPGPPKIITEVNALKTYACQGTSTATRCQGTSTQQQPPKKMSSKSGLQMLLEEVDKNSAKQVSQLPKTKSAMPWEDGMLSMMQDLRGNLNRDSEHYKSLKDGLMTHHREYVVQRKQQIIGGLLQDESSTSSSSSDEISDDIPNGPDIGEEITSAEKLTTWFENRQKSQKLEVGGGDLDHRPSRSFLMDIYQPAEGQTEEELEEEIHRKDAEQMLKNSQAFYEKFLKFAESDFNLEEQNETSCKDDVTDDEESDDGKIIVESKENTQREEEKRLEAEMDKTTEMFHAYLTSREDSTKALDEIEKALDNFCGKSSGINCFCDPRTAFRGSKTDFRASKWGPILISSLNNFPNLLNSI